MNNSAISKVSQIFGLDLRSLAVFRIILALIVIGDVFNRSRALTAHYTDAGVLPRSVLIDNLLKPGYWSIHLISGQPFLQALLFGICLLSALFLLVGYRTRLATIVTWILIISVQNRHPGLIFAGDHVLRAVLFWAMFLPLGAYYSIDNALNTSSKPLPKWIFNAATFAFLVQLCYIYMWSAAFKTKSPMWWPDGTAVYYALNFDQYTTSFGKFLAGSPFPLQKLLTQISLVFEWVGPLMIFIPFYNTFFRILAIISFSLLHIGFELSFAIGGLSYLSIANWLALIPSVVWDKLTDKFSTKKQQGLTIYYDADCGFCKKVVHLIRTFLILPNTPLIKAQEDESIYAAMQENNSWVVRDYSGQNHYKFDGIIYVCSLSPIGRWLVPILQLSPIKKLGTRIYETIASNRKKAGLFTKYLIFRPLEINDYRWLNLPIIFFLIITTIWNLKGFVDQTVARRPQQPNDWVTKTHNFLSRRIFQSITWIPESTHLDQIWSIFAPDIPRDDGWYVIVGKLKDGSEVNAFREDQPILWDKPTVQQRNDFYQTIQWRVYFIELNRAMGRNLSPYLVKYICTNWNGKHPSNKQLESIAIYFMDERTVPPGQTQGVKKTLVIEQLCSPKN